MVGIYYGSNLSYRNRQNKLSKNRYEEAKPSQQKMVLKSAYTAIFLPLYNKSDFFMSSFSLIQLKMKPVSKSWHLKEKKMY